MSQPVQAVRENGLTYVVGGSNLETDAFGVNLNYSNGRYVSFTVGVNRLNYDQVEFYIEDLIVNELPQLNITYTFSCIYDDALQIGTDGTNALSGIVSEQGDAYTMTLYSNSTYWGFSISLGTGVYDTSYGSLKTTYYNQGREVGYQEGYEIGKADGLVEGNSWTGPFQLIGSAFESVSSLMSVNIVGGLTIGALVGIPLTITVIITIFRIMRK